MAAIPFLLNNWKYLVMAGLIAVAAFYRWDANRWEAKYEAFRAEVAAVAAVAEAKAKETKATQDKKTEKVKHASIADRSRISDYYRLRLPADGGGSLPAPSDSPASPNEPTAEQAVSRPSVESCALDAEQVMAWQAWAREQGFPVE